MRCLLCLVGLWALSLPAHGQIYECVDEDGIKRFTNIAAEAKGCKALNILPTEPPPPPPSAPATGAPRTQGKSVPPATPSNFPRVDRRPSRRATMIGAASSSRSSASNTSCSSRRGRSSPSRKPALARELPASPRRIEPYQRRVRMHEDNVASLRPRMTRPTCADEARQSAVVSPLASAALRGVVLAKAVVE